MTRSVWPIAAYAIIGVAVLGNGAALVVHIVRGVQLPLALVAFWSAGLVAIVAVLVRSTALERSLLARTFLVGVAAGFAATVAYDVAKALLSNLDPAPWNPFEATRVFGTLFLGPDAPDGITRAVGWGFHFANGITFGVAFAFLFGRWATRGPLQAVALGVAWGIFLETFQLALYPGWMSIRFLDEFRQVSFLGHVVFGATLGILVAAGLRRVAAGARS